MTFKEIEKLIRDDGWVYENTRSSHYYYPHPVKKGKVTVPNHKGGHTQGYGKLNTKTSRS